MKNCEAKKELLSLTPGELCELLLSIGEPRYRIGNPRFCPDRGIIERYAAMSAPYGTEICVNADGIGIVTIPEGE